MASPEGVSVQTVKLKVLYTFDTDSKDNHLARWPHSLEVNTCFVDNTTQIGVVDLRTCLEAVITASPELTSRADQDYAVYAYDYSEEDTPLVGQGMLSNKLSMQDDVAEQDIEAMITGKVTKGLMGLLAKMAQPTLEVKLRFKSVNVFPGQRQRSGSVSSQDGRPMWLQNDNSFSQSQQRPSSPGGTSGLETMQRMLSEGGPPRERNGSMAPESYTHSRPASRAGTPSFSQNHNPGLRQPADAYSRPESRSGMRPQLHARRDSFNSGYYSGEEEVDNGPARKRAKTSKVDLPTKSNFNIEKQPNSLRMVASAAQSVRIHQPIAIKPSVMLQTGTVGEEPVRPPTPIPSAKGGKPRGRPRKIIPSNLAPSAPGPNPSSSLHVPLQSDVVGIAASSPEDTRPRSASTTPANIPSSPPLMFEQPGPAVTSPALPPMMNHDSGFMSGNLDDMFMDGALLHFDDFLLDKPQTQHPDLGLDPNDMRLGNEYTPVFEEGNDVEQPQPEIEPEPEPTKPPKIPIPPPPPPRPISRSQSFTPAARVGMSSPKLAPAPFPGARQVMEEQRAKEQKTKPKLPPLPASEPGARSLQRSNTWAPEHSDALMSEILDGDEPTKPKSKKKVGKEQTKARLENAIAAGEMPPYCDNCGCIETPAWRRGYAKVFEGNLWDEVETSLNQGGVAFKEVSERNLDGSIKTFRGLKSDKAPEDEENGWKIICLCNPCGLWFHKQKCPRPKEKWQKKADGRGKRKRATKKGQKQPNAKSDAPTPMSDESSPADTATDAPDYNDYDNDYDDTNTGEDETRDSQEPQLPLMPQNMRASSAEPVARGLARARPNHLPKTRQAQSSPGHRGSQAEPIGVGLTPKLIRRQLFPSPNKVQIRSDPIGAPAGTRGPADLPNFVRRSPRLNKTRDVFQTPGVAGAVALTAEGKENVMPEFDIEADLDAMIAETLDDEQPLLPSTPTPNRRSERLFMKTPQREFGLERSPNAQLSPTFRTPKPKRDQHPMTAVLLGTAIAKKNPLELTPFSRLMHETLNGLHEQTPGSAYDLGSNTTSKGKGSKRSTPGRNLTFDFPDLPSLNDSSPVNPEKLLNMTFSELPTDILHTDMNDPFNTDAPMPSSPPAYMDFLNLDELTADDVGWEAIGAPQVTESLFPDPETLSVAPPPPQVLRRSPRKNKGR